MTGGTPETSHLLTDHLDLQALTAGDLNPLHPIISDQRNCVHIPEGPKESLEDSRAWIERFSARWDANRLGYWTVRLRTNSVVIGVGGAERRSEFWNLYYLLDRNYWGHGYGTELGACRPASRCGTRTRRARRRVDTRGNSLASRGTAPWPDRLRPAGATALAW